MKLIAKIENIKYEKAIIKQFSVKYSLEENNINDLPSVCQIRLKDSIINLSKWVSPKRTRSYPYSKVYDSLDGAKRVIAIIPVIKDEGKDGDCDYLQWDSISLMSLLNVYVIIGYYSEAQVNKSYENKITDQKFDDEYIKSKIKEISNYHSSALHWNLKELKNIDSVIDLAITSYEKISSSLNVKIHNFDNFHKFQEKIKKDSASFIEFSRNKAKLAQKREIATMQPKESIGIGEKTPIEISNYLGGKYYFTIDDVLIENNIYKLIESKHSKLSLIPSYDDIKDGLLKMILYTNFANLSDGEKLVEYKPIIRLTSAKLTEKYDFSNFDRIFDNTQFSNKQKSLLLFLKQEAIKNGFEIILEKSE